MYNNAAGNYKGRRYDLQYDETKLDLSDINEASQTKRYNVVL